jgi:hypothetical protein
MQMVAANEAAVISGLSARGIYRFVEDGRLHFIEDSQGLLFVCLASLRVQFKEKNHWRVD